MTGKTPGVPTASPGERTDWYGKKGRKASIISPAEK